MTITVATNLLAPAAVLVLWSIVVLFWMVARRLPALKPAKIDLASRVGGRGQDLDGVLPGKINWPAHNYAHLMEQPTIFYAAIIILALLGQGTALNLALAWGYVAIRIVHSVWQINVNKIPLRMQLFFVSTMLLLILAINAVRATLSV